MKPGPKPKGVIRRLIDMVEFSQGGCWNWKGTTRNGYGQLGFHGMKAAHRLSYELFVGPIPHGLVIMHLCDNRSCVNPEHLIAATQKENVHDQIKKGRFVYPDWSK